MDKLSLKKKKNKQLFITANYLGGKAAYCVIDSEPGLKSWDLNDCCERRTKSKSQITEDNTGNIHMLKTHQLDE